MLDRDNSQLCSYIYSSGFAQVREILSASFVAQCLSPLLHALLTFYFSLRVHNLSTIVASSSPRVQPQLILNAAKSWIICKLTDAAVEFVIILDTGEIFAGD